MQPVLSAPSFAPVTTQLAVKQQVLSSFCHPPTRTPQASAAQAAGTALAETGGFLRAADTSVRQHTPRVNWRAAVQAVAADLAHLERADALKGQGAAAKAATDRSAWAAWLARYAARLRAEAAAGADGAARIAAMNAVNPRYVLRNWCGLRL